MTKYFLLLLVVIFIIVTFLPLKFIAWAALTYKFYRGRFFHRKRLRNNHEVAKIEF